MKDEVARRSAKLRADASAAANAEAERRRRHAPLVAAFKADFADAVQALAAAGAVPLPVVAQTGGGAAVTILAPKVRIKKVFPFTAIPIGGWFLHQGKLYKGLDGPASVGSWLKGVKRGQRIIRVTPDFMDHSVDDHLVVTPPDARSTHPLEPLSYRRTDGEGYVWHQGVNRWLSDAIDFELREVHGQVG